MAVIERGDRIQGGLDVGLHKSVVVLTTAQVRALNSTARTIVPSPGTGLAIFPSFMTIKMNGATAFTGIASGEDLLVRYDGTVGTTLAVFETIGFLNQTDRPTWGRTFGNTSFEVRGDEELELANSGPITGGSPLLVTTYYRLVEV